MRLQLINENGTDIDFSTVTGSFQSIEDNGCSEYDFTFKSTLSFKTREQFTMSIYEMLKNVTPVIARIGYGDGLIPFINNAYTGKSFNDVNRHYIMITEIYYDVINDKYALTCSS